MATVICNMADCIYRSKRKLKKWIHRDGEPCYGCTREVISVCRPFDPDGDIAAISGEGNMAKCAHYKPKKRDGADESYNVEDEDGE